MTEERKKRLEQALSEMRQKAVEAEAAIRNTQIREKFSKMQTAEQERFERTERNRKFATPSNSEEADLQLPKLCLDVKNTLENLGNLALIDKIRLYFTLKDFGKYFDSNIKYPSSIPPNKIEEDIIKSVKTDEDKKLLIRCSNEWEHLNKNGGLQIFYFKNFQSTFAYLALLLNRWSSYEEEAGRLTGLLKEVKEKTLSFVTDAIERCSHEWEGAALRFDHDSEAFSVNVDMEGGLYSQIQEEAKTTARALSDFKAYAVVLQDYIKKSKLKYMPIVIKVSIENAKDENYTRFLVRDKSFFRSDLNQRRCKGEAITPEQERRAVIPDYYEVIPAPEVFENVSE